MSTIGQRIKHFREEVGMTQTELSELLGCGKSFVSAIENDKSKPTVENLIVLLTKCGVNINYILGDVGGVLTPPKFEDVKSEILSSVNDILEKYGITDLQD